MDLTGWLEFFVGGLSTQLEEAKTRGERAIRRDVLVSEHRLNPRQALAMDWLLEHREMRIEDLEALRPGVHRRTLQRDLQGLVARGLAKIEGTARATRYLLGAKGNE
jgi:predicted transcriptional regulator